MGDSGRARVEPAATWLGRAAIVSVRRGASPLVQTLASRRNRQESPMKTLMFLAALFVSTGLLVPTVSVAQPLFC